VRATKEYISADNDGGHTSALPVNLEGQSDPETVVSIADSGFFQIGPVILGNNSRYRCLGEQYIYYKVYLRMIAIPGPSGDEALCAQVDITI
jgi:hypothetical protein